MKDNKAKKLNKEDYYKYISESTPCINQLKEYVGKDGYRLDFTSESLKFVDDLYRKNIAKKEKSYELDAKIPELSKQESWLIVRIAYYVAEVLIKNLGAQWELDNKKNSPSYNNAVIVIKGTIVKIEPLRVIYALISNDRSIYEWYRFIEGKYKPK